MKKNHKALRIILIVIGSLLVALLAAGLWINQYYKGIVRKQLPEWTADASNGSYKSSIDDISINLLTRRVHVKGLRLWYDTTAVQRRPARLHCQLFIPHMYVSGVAWERLLQQKELSFKSLLLSAPQIHLVQTNDSAMLPPDTAGKKPALKSIAAAEILVDNPEFVYEVPASKTRAAFKGGVLKLQDWLLEPGNETPDTSRLLFAKYLHVQLFKLVYTKASDPYKYSLDTLYVDQQQGLATLSNLQIRSSVDKKSYYKIIGHQKDLFDVRFPIVKLYGIDLAAALRHKTIGADSVLTDRGSVDVYFSRLYTPDPRSKLGRFPHQMLQKLPIKVRIAQVLVQRGHASYTEVNEETAQPGALPFDQITGNIRNVTNDRDLIAANAHCVASLRGKFMKTSDVSAVFDFLLSDSSGVFSLTGKVKNVQDHQVSGQAKALGKVEIKTLDMQSLDLKMNANQYAAKGSVALRYSNLELQIKNLDDDKKLKDKPLLSFLVNKMVLYPDNPMKGKDLRTAEVSVQRDPHKSFFNLIWRTVLEGAKKTAVRNEQVVKAVSKKK